MEKIDKTHWYWLCGILACALALRVGFGLSLTDLGQSSDEQHWDGLGRAFERLGVMHLDTGFYRPPLYGLLLAGVYKAFGHSFEAVRLLQALIGTATCVLVYCLGRVVGCQVTGLLAAGLCALYPMFVFFTGVLMAETLLIFLTTLCILLYLNFEARATFKGAILLGMAGGITTLCKPVLVLWMPAVLFLWWYRSYLNMKKKLILIALVVGCIGVVVLPWTLRNYTLSGKLIPVSANVGINLLVGNHPQSNGFYENQLDYISMYKNWTGTYDFTVGDSKMIQIVFQWFSDDPLRFVFLSFVKAFWLWFPWVLDASVLSNFIVMISSGPLMLIGGWGLVKLQQTQARWVLTLFVVGITLLHMIFFAHTRFRLPIDAVLCVTAAWSIKSYLKVRRGGDGC